MYFPTVTGNFENKMLASFSKSENQVRPAVTPAMIFSETFCRLDLEDALYFERRQQIKPFHRSGLQNCCGKISSGDHCRSNLACRLQKVTSKLYVQNGHSSKSVIATVIACNRF